MIAITYTPTEGLDNEEVEAAKANAKEQGMATGFVKLPDSEIRDLYAYIAKLADRYNR